MPVDEERGALDVGQDFESYYSEQEQESYEPPLSYDQEDSVLSFEMENEPREVGQFGEQIVDDEFDDFDNYRSSNDSFSDEDSHMHHHHQNHHHQHHPGQERIIHHHPMNVANLPIHAQLW